MLTLLKISHMDQCLELWENNPGLWKLKKEYEDYVEPFDFFYPILTNSFAIGWIENNKLLSMASMFYWPDSDSATWAFYGNVKTNYVNWEKTKGHLVLSAMFKEAIKMRKTSITYLSYKDFPAMTVNPNIRMLSKLEQWYSEKIPEINYYHWVDEAIIPANTLPQHTWQKFIMLKMKWPIDLRIRAGVMKQEFREKFFHEQYN